MPRVVFYSHFARFTRGDRETTVEGVDVKDTIDHLVQSYGREFASRLLDDDGNPKEFVRIFVNDKDIRLLGNLNARTAPGDEVLIVPAITGG